jgi:hypothetical protein
MGSLKPNREGINEVQDDFYLATAGDIVADPSAPDAFVNGIMEGVEWIWDNGVLRAAEIQQIKENVESDIRSRVDRQESFAAAFSNFMSKISR